MYQKYLAQIPEKGPDVHLSCKWGLFQASYPIEKRFQSHELFVLSLST